MINAYQTIDFGEKGVCKGIYYGQHDRVDELNNRIQTRHFPDVQLPPNFDPRPVSTKFCLFPTLDIRTSKSYNKKEVNDDETRQTFVYNPGTDRGPPITFLKNIHIENDLRKEYIPNTSSQLYTNQANPTVKTSRENAALFSSLPLQSTGNWSFHKPQLGENPNFLLKGSQKYTTHVPNYLANPHENTPPSSQRIGENMFNNFTKVQLRNMVLPTHAQSAP